MAAIERAAPAASEETPTITSVGPTTVHWGDSVTVAGDGFGDEVGAVLVEGAPTRGVIRWSDNEVDFWVPGGAKPGPRSVVIETPTGVRSNAASIEVLKFALPGDAAIAPGKVIAQLAPLADPTAIVRRHGLLGWEPAFGSLITDPSLRRFFAFRVPEGEEAAAVLELAEYSDIETVHPSFTVSGADAAPNDPLRGTQGNIAQVNLPVGWDYEKGAANSILAVIDGSVDFNHVDLDGNHPFGGRIHGENAQGNPFNSVNCGGGHGTHVAGIAAAETNNGVGVSSVAWATLFEGYGVFDDPAAAQRVRNYLLNSASPVNCGNRGAGNCGRGVLDAAVALKLQELDHVRGYEYTTGGSTGAPDVSSWGPGRLDVFWVGADKNLYHRWYNDSTGWLGNENLGAPGGGLLQSPALNSDVTAVSWAPGRIDVFGRGPGQKLWHKWYAGNAWSGWEDLGTPPGVQKGLGSGPDAASSAPGLIDVFALNKTGQLVVRSYNGTTWGSWQNLGAPVAQLDGDPTAVSWGPGRVDVFIKGKTDNRIYQRFLEGSWSSWFTVGGAGTTIKASPDAASWAPGRIDLFAQGTDNQLYRLWWDNSGFWSHADGLGGTLLSGPGAVSWGPDRFDVFVRGASDGIYHGWRVP